MLSFDALCSLSTQCGLDLLGIVPVIELAEDRKALEAWQQAGHAGEMRYMQRDPGLLTTPSKLLGEARSIVSFGIPYERRAVGATPRGAGRVARYAWGKDYHDEIPMLLRSVHAAAERELGRTVKARIFTDAVPLLERAVARASDLGFIGKNTMLIAPRSGSYLFLSEILWDVEVHDVPPPRVRGRCGDCARCLNSCPTGAFEGPYVLDARRCISYLTIEKRGGLSSEERAALGEWIFGCDICQEVCPFNHAPVKLKGRKAVRESLCAAAGVGPFLDLSDVLAIRSDDIFRSRFRGTPLLRTKREGLLRNAACVAANTCATEALHALIDATRTDSSGMVRMHATHALAELASRGAVRKAYARENIEPLRQDPEPGVRNEIESILDRLS